MPSPCGPEHAPAGDVGTAVLLVDSQLKAYKNGVSAPDASQRQLTDQFVRSLDSESAGGVLDGTCTLIYLWMEWLRQAHDAMGQDLLENLIPYLVRTLNAMTRTVRPEGIPTVVGLIIASAIGQSPTLWRKQYGPWTNEEMPALEATAFLLAKYINDLTQDPDAATRMITEALSSAEQDETPTDQF